MSKFAKSETSAPKKSATKKSAPSAISQIALTAGLSATAFTAMTGTAMAGTSQGNVDVWSMLQNIKITETVTDTSYEVKKSYPAEMDTLGETVEITGYAMQMYADENIVDILMVADMGVCPFCGGSDHAGSLQVTLAEPIQFLDESNRITIRGSLKKVTDPETWQAAILENAEIVTR